jgi:hypothetical protein
MGRPAFLGDTCSKAVELRHSLVVQHDELAVEDAVCQRRQIGNNLGEVTGEIDSIARDESRLCRSLQAMMR